MTETIRRLGRLYTDRVRDAQDNRDMIASCMRDPRLFRADCDFDVLAEEARESATFGLEALALRSVLLNMARARSGPARSSLEKRK